MSVDTYSIASIQKFIEKSVKRFEEPCSVASLLPFGKYAEELLKSADLLHEPFTIALDKGTLVSVDGVDLLPFGAYQPSTSPSVYLNALLAAAHQALAGGVVVISLNPVFTPATITPASFYAFYIISLFLAGSAGSMYKPTDIPVLKNLLLSFFNLTATPDDCDTPEEKAQHTMTALANVYYPNGANLCEDNDIVFSVDCFQVVCGTLIDICPLSKKDCKCTCEPRCPDDNRRRKDCNFHNVKYQKYRVFDAQCVVPPGFYRRYNCKKAIATRYSVNDPSAVDYHIREHCGYSHEDRKDQCHEDRKDQCHEDRKDREDRKDKCHEDRD